MLISHENLEFSMARDNFPLKKGIFYQWVKRWHLFVLINARTNGHIFRVKISQIYMYISFIFFYRIKSYTTNQFETGRRNSLVFGQDHTQPTFASFLDQPITSSMKNCSETGV